VGEERGHFVATVLSGSLRKAIIKCLPVLPQDSIVNKVRCISRCISRSAGQLL